MYLLFANCALFLCLRLCGGVISNQPMMLALTLVLNDCHIRAPIIGTEESVSLMFFTGVVNVVRGIIIS